MKNQIFHDYYCQIMTQNFSFIYIYRKRFPILTLGIPTDLKSQMKM